MVGENTEDKAQASRAFKDEERFMINGVLTLASRSIRSLMTPRNQISWVDAESSVDDIRVQLLDTPHSSFPGRDGGSWMK